MFVYWPLWTDLSGAHLAASESDQTAFEWFLAHAAHRVSDPGNPFFTTALNPPFGANMMAQASVLAIGLVLAPVTLTLGPTVSLAVALTGALAATAAGWYFVLSRKILPADAATAADGERPGPVGTRVAAALGGAFAGFSPTIVSHAAGAHLNLIAQFLLPFIAWQAANLHRRPWRAGLWLGLLAAAQIFIGEELLLLTALALAVFVPVAATQRATTLEEARRYLGGLAFAAGVALAVTAYPLWMQFLGPQSYADLPYNSVGGARWAALTGYSSESVGAMSASPKPGIVLDAAEQNGFFGWPLLIFVVLAGGWLFRRSPVARAFVVTGAVFLLLSTRTDKALADLPALHILPPARLALVVSICVGILLALLVHRVRTARWLLGAALVAVLLPVAPTPLTVDARAPIPAFFTDDQWQRYVRPGHTLVSARHPDHGYAEPMRWQMAAGLRFNINGGYILSPFNAERDGWYTPPSRYTEVIFAEAAQGQTRALTDQDRAAAVADLRQWRADAVVLVAGTPGEETLRATVSDLYGVPETFVGGVWVGTSARSPANPSAPRGGPRGRRAAPGPVRCRGSRRSIPPPRARAPARSEPPRCRVRSVAPVWPADRWDPAPAPRIRALRGRRPGPPWPASSC